MVLSGRCATGVADTGLTPAFDRDSGQHASIRVPVRIIRPFLHPHIYLKSDNLAKTNFQYEKRQKELEKKKKKEEKLKRKSDKDIQPDATAEQDPEQPAPADGDAQTGTP